MDAALSDGVAAAISIAHGLVFELVPEPRDSSNLFRNRVPRTFPAADWVRSSLDMDLVYRVSGISRDYDAARVSNL